MVGPLRFYPPYTNGLMVHDTFFFCLIMAWNGLWQFFFFFPIFGLKQPDFREKKVFFCLVVRGVYPPYTLSGTTTKKTFFLCVSSLISMVYSLFVYSTLRVGFSPLKDDNPLVTTIAIFEKKITYTWHCSLCIVILLRLPHPTPLRFVGPPPHNGLLECWLMISKRNELNINFGFSLGDDSGFQGASFIWAF